MLRVKFRGFVFLSTKCYYVPHFSFASVFFAVETADLFVSDNAAARCTLNENRFIKMVYNTVYNTTEKNLVSKLERYGYSIPKV